MSVLKLFNTNIERYVDALYALLITTDETQFFPEMYEIFGREAVIKFLDIFAGQTIVVPSREFLENHIRDATVWVEMQKGEQSIVQIAERHGITMVEVQKACDRVHEALSKLGIVVTEVRPKQCWKKI